MSLCRVSLFEWHCTECHYTECHYTECHYAYGHGAIFKWQKFSFSAQPKCKKNAIDKIFSFSFFFGKSTNIFFKVAQTLFLSNLQLQNDTSLNSKNFIQYLIHNVWLISLFFWHNFFLFIFYYLMFFWIPAWAYNFWLILPHLILFQSYKIFFQGATNIFLSNLQLQNDILTNSKNFIWYLNLIIWLISLYFGTFFYYLMFFWIPAWAYNFWLILPHLILFQSYRIFFLQARNIF
jgi:hypothetical protein